jgi:superfamily II DNA or RNA helicase
MDLRVEHNKTYISNATDDELQKTTKALRIWYQDHLNNLLLFNLYNKKEMSFPTGYLGTVLKKIRKRSVTPIVTDNRRYVGPQYSFSKKDAADIKPLWEHQTGAIEAIDKNPTGIISSATGSGKSRILLEAFHLKKVKTLIIVPSTTIQKQLYKDFSDSIGKKNVSIKAPKLYKPKVYEVEDSSPSRLGSSYLDSLKSHSSSKDVQKKKMGSSYLDDVQSKESAPKKKLGSSYLDDLPKKQSEPEREYLKRKKDPEKFKKWQKKQLEKKYKIYKKLTEYPVTILCYQSLDEIPKEFLETIECVMVDECHHASARTIREPLLEMKNAAYRYGFSATPWRDKWHEELLLISALGDKQIYDFSAMEAVEKGIIAKPIYQIINSPTPDAYLRDIRHWRTILEEGIIGNKARNKAIVRRTEELVANHKNVLICVDEISHLEILQTRLKAAGVNPHIIHGQMNDKEKDKNIETVSFGEGGMASIATMAVGEGANLVNIDVVILAGGGKGSIRFLQRIGRGARKTATKFEVLIIDFEDWFNPTLAKHSRLRKEIFNSIYGKKK